MCMQVPGEARRDFRSLGAGVKGSCELPNRNARDQTLVLWKSNQYYLLSCLQLHLEDDFYLL